MSESIEVILADLANPVHAAAVGDVIEAYAREVMPAGLSSDARQFLISGLRAHPTHLVFLARQGEQTLGAAVCFIGFSTFAARPLINIHDLAVLPHTRRAGVGRALLAAIETRARELGCVKITLEVRDDNLPAQQLYQNSGYCSTDSAAASAQMLFWHKRVEGGAVGRGE